MDAARLRAMSLAELRREASERGVARSARLSREALIEQLLGLPAGEADAAQGEAAGGSSRGGRSDKERPGARTKRERVGTPADAPTVPSTTAPDRPAENDPEVMARLYLQQGQPDRAAELYRELLASRPGDDRLLARLAAAEVEIAARAGRRPPAGTPEPNAPEITKKVPLPDVAAAPPPPAPSGEPLGMLDLEELPDGYGVDECEVLPKDPYHVFVYWEVTEHGLGSARQQLGGEAGASRLVLRLFATADPGEPGPERETRDIGLDGLRGRRYLPVGRPGLRLRAAVGLVAPSGLFAPICHSSPARVPPAEPAPPGPVRWMEVRPGRTAGREREAIEVVAAESHERGVFPSEPPPRGQLSPTSPGSPWRFRPGGSSGSGRDGG
jgi:hypothetical protein